MLKAAAERGWLNEKDAVLEALLCLKRAGSGEGRLQALRLCPRCRREVAGAAGHRLALGLTTVSAAAFTALLCRLLPPRTAACSAGRMRCTFLSVARLPTLPATDPAPPCRPDPHVLCHRPCTPLQTSSSRTMPQRRPSGWQQTSPAGGEARRRRPILCSM